MSGPIDINYTDTVETVSDLDIVINEDGTYGYQSTFMYGVHGIIDSVYKIEGQNKLLIEKTNYSYDKLFGNIKINLPYYDYGNRFIVYYYKLKYYKDDVERYLYINQIFKMGVKSII